MRAEDCLVALQSQTPMKIDQLPDATGVYALSDHLGVIRYIGITVSLSFRDRARRHVDGSEERSHKLACNYNIGRMWRGRKYVDHVDSDARIAKRLRHEFILSHCHVVCVPLKLPTTELMILEKDIIHLAPTEMSGWNNTRKRVNRIPEPRDLTDVAIRKLGLSLSDREALERQAVLFQKHGDKDLI